MNLELSTSRLQLIPFTYDEVNLFYTLNTDPFIRQYLWDNTIIDQETAQEILTLNETHFQKDHYGIWKIVLSATHEVIGFAGLWFFFEEPQPQLIYALKEPFTGNGYATEAARALIDYTFTSLGFTYLLAAMDEPHFASQKVAERLGMQPIAQRLENGKPTVFYKIDKASYSV